MKIEEKKTKENHFLLLPMSELESGRKETAAVSTLMKNEIRYIFALSGLASSTIKPHEASASSLKM